MPFDDTSISDERSDEKVSDIRLFGSRTSCSIAKPSCIFGMAPSDGRPSLRPTSSGVRITLNNCSRPRTNNAANNRTASSATAMCKTVLGLEGLGGDRESGVEGKRGEGGVEMGG